MPEAETIRAEALELRKQLRQAMLEKSKLEEELRRLETDDWRALDDDDEDD